MKIVFTLVIWLLPLLWTPLRAKLDASTASARLLDANFRLRQLKGIWSESKEDEGPLNASEVKILREEAWEMFDHGYSNYMRHAFPLDNLLPVSCRGEDWQGGLGLTLIDALDTLLLMNRTEDIRIAVDLMEKSINFDKDVKVHVFETVIRGLGGLLSGHVLLRDKPDTVPGYNGMLLRMAVDLADRLLPAFDTPSGLPVLFVNLQGGLLFGNNLTCTACAGTLLMEFGMLSALTGRPVYMRHAHRVAKAMFELRSPLGLVGSSLDVKNNKWSHRESTIGPGTDSYYEYLLKSYLMFGEISHLEMFAELYASTMRYLAIPGTVKGFAFLMDVNMDTGKLSKSYVSSLGAFWPGMQALAGQEQDAVDLHANFTAAWQTFGWMPEMFGHDLSKYQVHPDDPGYNLRPEHVESTYMLHVTTNDPIYLRIASKLQASLSLTRVKCGFTNIIHVKTGETGDLMESYFLSETAKYLYLTFSNAPGLIDYYLFTTEGHLFPPMPKSKAMSDSLVDEEEYDEYLGVEDEEEEAEAEALNKDDFVPDKTNKASHKASVPASQRETGSSEGKEKQGKDEESAGGLEKGGSKRAAYSASCKRLCEPTSKEEQAAIGERLREAFPLLHFDPSNAALLRERRCFVCKLVTKVMAEKPPLDEATKAKIMQMPPDKDVEESVKVLSQIVCTLMAHKAGKLQCSHIRPVSMKDSVDGWPENSVVVQLSALEQPELVMASAFISGGIGNSVSLHLDAAAAVYGCKLPTVSNHCSRYILGGINTTVGGTPASDSNSLSKGDSPGASPGLSHTKGSDNLHLNMKTHTGRKQRRGSCIPGSGGVDAGCDDGKVAQDSTDEAAADSLWVLDPEQGYQSPQEPFLEPKSAPPLLSTPELPPQLGWPAALQCGAGDQGLWSGRRPAVWRLQKEKVKELLEHCGKDLMPHGPLVVPDPPNGCLSPVNRMEMQGAIAVVARGGCGFSDKTHHMQQAGAIAVIIVNIEDEGQFLNAVGDGRGGAKQPTIPTVLITRESGRRLQRALLQHAHHPSPLVATLGLQPVPLVATPSPEKTNEESGDQAKLDDCDVGYEGCKDIHKLCPRWASTGECAKNPNYMLHQCQGSCEVCRIKRDACKAQLNAARARAVGEGTGQGLSDKAKMPGKGAADKTSARVDGKTGGEGEARGEGDKHSGKVDGEGKGRGSEGRKGGGDKSCDGGSESERGSCPAGGSSEKNITAASALKEADDYEEDEDDHDDEEEEEEDDEIHGAASGSGSGPAPGSVSGSGSTSGSVSGSGSGPASGSRSGSGPASGSESLPASGSVSESAGSQQGGNPSSVQDRRKALKKDRERQQEAEAGRGGALPNKGQKHTPERSRHVPPKKQAITSPTRLDLLIPLTSQKYLHTNLLTKGYDVNTMFEWMLENGQLLDLLVEVANHNGFDIQIQRPKGKG